MKQEIRVSEVSGWVQCERRAHHTPPKRKSRKTSAAELVGTLAHDLIAGMDNHTVPVRIYWDSTTPTFDVAVQQARLIANRVTELLEHYQLEIEDVEIEMEHLGVKGRTDMLVFDRKTNRHILIDIKTGQNVGAGWLQVGGYLWLAKALNPTEIQVGAVLHVPRMQATKDVKAVLTLRDAHELIMEWEQYMGRYRDLFEGERIALPSPGFHCKHCPVTPCTVRAVEFGA